MIAHVSNGKRINSCQEFAHGRRVRPRVSLRTLRDRILSSPREFHQRTQTLHVTEALNLQN